MSHAPERHEKDCLNCGTIIHGRFCHVCGQENVVPKESFWKLVIHFFYDITHFDSKFFDSLRYLLFRPGMLSKEYIKGRRASYLNPIRMYVFTSAIFFLVFFSITGSEASIKITGNEPMSQAVRDSVIIDIKRKLEKDSANPNLRMQLKLLSDTSKELNYMDLLPYTEGFAPIGTLGKKYKSRHEYDSVQKALPEDKRDTWLTRLWNKKAIQINEKYRYDPTGSLKNIFDIILHKLPYLLFISLPFFALILKLLYIRRKQFFYADHGIFSIHHYILSFILLLFVFLLNKLDELTGWGVWSFLIVITIIAWPVHLLLAMKRFYGQAVVKTFFKFLLLNFIGLIVLMLLFTFFVLFSVFQL